MGEFVWGGGTCKRAFIPPSFEPRISKVGVKEMEFFMDWSTEPELFWYDNLPLRPHKADQREISKIVHYNSNSSCKVSVRVSL